ncbi:MAG: tryptophan--tRNA ligase [Planctomycetota bacterium]|jgi:tryptophanyl-tRNA synthetase
MNARPLRILSGIQPSGTLHLGNYFGAMAQHVALADEGEAYYFIADYHALTTVQDAPRLRGLVRDVALDYLAIGLDPARATLFRQSDVPEVAELTWILSCVTPMGLLERATSYKDKLARGVSPRAGLFFYPVLMAADILAYRSNLVPVGKDQVQHLEMARDIAQAFHRAFDCEVFTLPEARLAQRAEVVPGTDGQKMSKSYDNTIQIFAEGKALKKAVMSIKTDSRGVDEPKDPEGCDVYRLYRLVATPGRAEEMAEKLGAGGYGYGDAKKALLAAIEARFAPARERRRELAAEPERVEEVLADGGRRARREAASLLESVREITGMAGRPVTP